jgi:serine/threonine protein kinase
MKTLCLLAIAYPSFGEHYSGSYPVPGQTKLYLPDTTLLVNSYIDSGASTRVFSGVQMEKKASSMPTEVAIKCIYSRDGHLQKKIEHEFSVLKALNHHSDLRIPRAYYVSNQWSCGGSHKCQFLVMTKAGPDFSRVVTKNPLGLANASQKGRPGQFELFVASVGLCVVTELEKLHEAGAVHGDIGRYNVANDLNDPQHVMLIDFGQGKLKSELSGGEFSRRVERDFRRTNAFILRLIKTKINIDNGSTSDKSFRVNPLYSLVESIENNQKDLKIKLTDFIKREFGISFSGKIIF